MAHVIHVQTPGRSYTFSFDFNIRISQTIKHKGKNEADTSGVFCISNLGYKFSQFGAKEQQPLATNSVFLSHLIWWVWALRY